MERGEEHTNVGKYILDLPNARTKEIFDYINEAARKTKSKTRCA